MDQASIEQVVALVKEIGQEVLHKKLHLIQTKSGHNDLVSDLDTYVQDFLIERLFHHFPGSEFFCEEEGRHQTGDRLWIIDPIDGTTNFIRNREEFAVSVAYYEKQEPIFGIVYDVSKDNLYLGITNKGSFKNGVSMPTIGKRSINESILIMNFDSYNHLKKVRKVDSKALLEAVMAHRYYGCASLSIIKIAEGNADLYVSTKVKTWDFAAANIILKEVNGYVNLPYHKNKLLYANNVVLIASTSKTQYYEVIKLFS